MFLNALRHRLALVAAASLAVAGCASSGYGGLELVDPAVEVRTELPPPTPQAPTAAREYRIGPFDTIQINVFGVEDLTRSVTVDSSGRVPMPLIGDVQVAGRTPSEVTAEITERLRGRYLRDPQVSVGITEVRSQRVTVDGAVVQPGIYPVFDRMSLVQAIAQARGTTEFAAIEQIAIFRTVENQRMAALFSLRDIREGRLTDPEIYPNDIIVVGESGSRRLLRDILQGLPALGVFTPIVN